MIKTNELVTDKVKEKTLKAEHENTQIWTCYRVGELLGNGYHTKTRLQEEWRV